MQMTNIHEAKTHFSKLVERAAAGEEIVIAGVTPSGYNGTFAIMESSTTTATLKEIFYVASPSTVLFIESDAVAQTSGIMLIQ